MRPVENLVQRLNARRSGQGWKANCPAHDDHVPSLSIKEGADGRVLLKCFAGCSTDSVLAAIELKARDLFPVIQVTAKKPENTAESSKRATRPETVTTPIKPRPLGELLRAICEVLRRYVVFQCPEQAEAIALWTAHTWTLDAFEYTPYLHVFSAETTSGKSRLLEVLALLVKKPWKLESVSVAALFRRIELDQPTLLYDEIDNAFRGDGKDDDTKDLRACLNSGFKRGGTFTRCVGQNASLEVKEFATFCPKALTGIGRVLSDTLSNRCIPIELQRQSREEKAKRFREREAKAELAPLKAELQAWSQVPGVIDALRNARPALPEELTDRQHDITEPLLAIADTAGESWPEKARATVVKLCTQTEPVVSDGIKALIDIKAVFDDTEAEKLPTAEMLERLVAIEDDRPWPLWWAKEVSLSNLKSPAARLARLLKPYKIKPHTIWLPDGTSVKGYARSDFEEAWRRNLPQSLELVRNVRNVRTSKGANTRETDDSDDSDDSAEIAPCLTFSTNTDGDAHRLLIGLVNRIKASEVYPKGHSDCLWGLCSLGWWYPSEYTSALDYLDGGAYGEQAAFRELRGVVDKIEAQAIRGTPLVSNHPLAREWREGSYPPEYEAARSYVREQMEKLERELLAFAEAATP